jgi:hypothetical protein
MTSTAPGKKNALTTRIEAMRTAGIRSARATDAPRPLAAARARQAKARTGRVTGGRTNAARITQASPSSFVTGLRRWSQLSPGR